MDVIVFIAGRLVWRRLACSPPRLCVFIIIDWRHRHRRFAFGAAHDVFTFMAGLFCAVKERLRFHHHSTSSVADWLCRRQLVFLSSQPRVFATGLLMLPLTCVHFITPLQLCHHGGGTSSLLSSAPANSIAATSQVLLLHQPRRLQELRHLGIRHQIWCRIILLQQVVFKSSIFLLGHLQPASSLLIAMTTRRQEATVLDSMFSCFPTNQRVGGYTNTRLSNQPTSSMESTLGVISFVFASEQVFYFSNSNDFTSKFWLLHAATIYSKIFKYQVLHVREFRVINQSAQFRWVGQQHLLSFKWSICNSYNSKFYYHLYKSRGVASISVMHMLTSIKLFELRHLLNNLKDYCHWHHHQHLYFIGPNVSTVAKGWLRLRLRLLLSSPTYIADLLFRLHGWPTMQMLMGIFVIIIGCYTAIDWITDIVIFINILSSLFNIAYSTAVWWVTSSS